MTTPQPFYWRRSCRNRQQIRNFTADQRTTLASQIIHVQELHKHQLQPHTVAKRNLLIQILQCILSQLRGGRNSETNVRNSPFRNTRFLKDQEGIIKIDHSLPPTPHHLTKSLFNAVLFTWDILLHIMKNMKRHSKRQKAELERMSKHENQSDMTRMLKLSDH